MKKILLILCSFAIMHVTAFAQLTGNGSQDNPYSGTITSNTQWSSPTVYVAGVQVNQGVTLTIGPGVTVFLGDNSDLTVNGTLVANGNSSHITFTLQSANDTCGHIVFTPTSVNNVIDSCVFENCSGEDGGAIYISESVTLNIRNSIFRNNSSRRHGGAIFCNYSSTLNVYSCLFVSNESINQGGINGGMGGAIASLGATVNVTNSIFRNNEANDSSEGSGGAVCLERYEVSEDEVYYSDGVFINSLFEENHSSSATQNKGGGAISVLANCSADINNCTFINNTSCPEVGWLEAHSNTLQFSYSYDSYVRNSIIWSDTPDEQIVLYFVEHNILFSHCAYIDDPYTLEASNPTISGCFIISTNNMGDTNSPLFADPENHDWTLQMASPCVNASDSNATTHDINGQYAVGIRDLGVYELMFALFNGNGTPYSGNLYSIFDVNNWSSSPFDPNDPHRIIMDSFIPEEDGHNAYLPSDLTIANGASLVINAGKTLAINSNANITVDGSFVARGTSNNPVSIMGYNNSNWGHIHLRSGSIGEFANCSIRNGSSALGGAVRISTSNAVAISNVTFSNNQASQNGGALYIDAAGTVFINTASFTNNSANGNGGAIYTNNIVNITGTSVFNNNTANNGGALYLNGGNSQIASTTTFSNNQATNNGGAIYIGDSSTINGNVSFTSNSAVNGGAIFINAGESTITNATFGNASNGNSANYGGAIYIAGGNPTFTSLRFTSNSANNEGGALYIHGGNPSLTNSYFTNNHSTGAGGAVSFNGSSTTGSIINCIFEGNSSSGTTNTTTGAAMAISGNASPYVRNCTFVENSNNTSLPYTLMLNGAGTSTRILNNVFWRRGAAYVAIVCSNRNDLSRISYCAYTAEPFIVSENTNAGASNSIIISYINDADNGPHFNDNWSIRALSALRNAGDPSITGTTDIMGTVQIGVRDIGAFEATMAFFNGGVAQASIGGNYYEFFDARNWSTNPFSNDNTIVMDISVPADCRYDVYVSNNINIPNGITFNIEGGRNVYISSGRSITVNGELNANLDGSNTITFTGDINNGWGRIKFNSNANGLFNNCVFEYADSSALVIEGTVRINNSVFRGNTTPTRGAAMYTSGGAIYVANNGRVEINRSTFYNNQAVYGGAIRFNNNSSGFIYLSLFYDNRIIGTSYNSGGSISLNTSSSIDIVNCTVVNNNTLVYGDLIHLMGQGNYTLTNSVFWNRNDRNSYPITVDGNPTIHYNRCAHSTTTNNTSVIAANCFTLSSTNDGLNPKGPHFRDPNNNNWMILPYSPLRDAGTSRPDGMETTDIAGNQIVRYYDIGAYEAQFAYWTGASTNDYEANGDLRFSDWSIDYVKNFEDPDNWSVYPIDPSTSNIIMDIVMPSYGGHYTAQGSWEVDENNQVVDSGRRFILGPDRIIVVEPTARLNIPSIDLYGKIRLQSDGQGNVGSYRATIGYTNYGGLLESELWLSGGINTAVGPDAYRWHYIASPFPNTSTSQFEAQTLNLSKYDNELEWVAYDGYVYADNSFNSSEEFHTMEVGHGYNYYSDEDHMYLLSGTHPNFFDTYIPLDSGWNLLGNPFPTGADWETIVNYNWYHPNDYNHGLYFTKDNRQYSYIDGVSTPLPNYGTLIDESMTDYPGSIPPYQGFFVKAYTDTVTFRIPINAKISQYPENYKGPSKKGEDIPLIRVALRADTIYFDDTVLRFGTGARYTTAVNDSLDAYKAFKKTSQTLIYSKFNNTDFAIKSLPIPDTTYMEIPLTIQIAERGNYTINISQFQNLDNYKIYLKDNVTGSFTQVVSTRSGISFTSEVGTSNRFSLVFYGNNIPTNVEDVNVDANGFKVYASNGMIKMIPLESGWDARTANVRLIDMTGKIISLHNGLGFTTNTETSIPAPKNTGIYIVEIINNNNRIVEKVFVR